MVSVIVPNYNHAKYLEERVNSILTQTYHDFELIILDDGSTDQSRDVIESFRTNPKISHIIYNDKNSGSPFSQWKKGIELAKGEWIWIAESDDIAEPTFLEQASKAFTNNPSAGLFYCDGRILDEETGSDDQLFSTAKNKIFETNRWGNDYCENGVTELNEYLKFDNTINNASSVVFKKQLFDAYASEIGQFRYYGDWFFYIKACLVTDLCYCPIPLNIYRKHKSNHSGIGEPVLLSRKEYFMILRLLYYDQKIAFSEKLLDHFCYHYLNLGLFSHSPGNSLRVIKAYFKIEKKLGWKVLPRLIWMKLFRKKIKNKIQQIDPEA